MPLVILPESHCDHVSQATIEYIVANWADRSNPSKSVIIETIELPEGQELPCSLHGPAMGDESIPDSEAFHATREGRNWPSRLTNRPARMTRLLTVVAGPYGNDELVLYTCYGGPVAQREPMDPALPDTLRAESEEFWNKHALSGD